MKVSTENIVGKTSDWDWAQVAFFSLENEVKLAVVISVVGVDGALNIGKAALEAIRSEFDRVGSISDRLRAAIELAGNMAEGGQLQVIAAGISGVEIVVGATDGTMGGMKRDGSWGWLVKGNGLESINLVKGVLNSSDRILLGTNKLFEIVGESGLTESMGLDSLQESGELLSGLVNKTDDIGSAGLLVEVKGSEELKVEVVGESNETTNSKLRQVFGKGTRKLLGRRWARKTGHRDPSVYIAGEKKKKLTGSVALILLLLLGASVFLGWRKRVADERSQQLAIIIDPASATFSEAQSLIDTNPLRARSLLVEARDELTGAWALFDEKSPERASIEELLAKINSVYDDVAGEVKLGDLKPFYELSFIRDDVFGDQLAIVGNELTVLDKSQGLVMKMEVESKQGEVIGGGEAISGAKLMAANVGRVVVLNNNGITAVWFDIDRGPELLVETEEDWEDPVQIGTFGGNVYLLDKGSSELWRYPGFDGGVGARLRWLGPGVVPDFGGIVDMEIDGDVWLLDADGTVTSYRQGAPTNFRLSGLVDTIDEAVAMAVSVDGDGVYVLDRGNSRVVVFSKEGEYKKQYLWDGMKGVGDMAVSENEDGTGNIYLLSGQDIYQIPIQ